MNRLIVKALMALALPAAAILCGVWLMFEISGYERVNQSLARAAPADRKPLYRRLTYDIDAVRRHWRALDGEARQSERLFLQLDLVFPLLYGAALAFGLLTAWDALGRRFNPAWVLAPVLIAMLSDWAENLIQLRQFGYYMAGADLQAGWIRAASVATLLKLLSVGGACLTLFSMTCYMLVRASRRS